MYQVTYNYRLGLSRFSNLNKYWGIYIASDILKQNSHDHLHHSVKYFSYIIGIA
jgi:hypothetical protein